MAGLEASQHPRKDASATFASAEETVSGMVSELSFVETDLLADDQKVFADHTSHYTGRLNGRIVFEGRQQLSIAPWSKQHIYVFVRWGVSTWIVTDSSPKDSSLKKRYRGWSANCLLWKPICLLMIRRSSPITRAITPDG